MLNYEVKWNHRTNNKQFALYLKCKQYQKG